MKHIYQSLNLHGNIITDGGAPWPTENKHLVNKEYVDSMIAQATGVDLFREGVVTGEFFIRNLNPYKIGHIERNNGWEALVLTNTNFNDRPNDTTPTVKMTIGETELNFTNVDETADSYGFFLQENQHLYRYQCTTNIGNLFIGNDSIITIEQIFSQIEVGEITHQENTITISESLNGLYFKFLPVISIRFDEPLSEIQSEYDEPNIDELGISTTTRQNINIKSMSTKDGNNLLPQNYYLLLPKNDNLPNNNPMIGFYFWFKDNETNECVSQKTFIDVSQSEVITWCGVDCNVLFIQLGYIDVPNDKLSLVIDSVFF